MQVRHFIAAILLAFGIGQQAHAQEPNKPETQQETQRTPASAEQQASAAHEEKPAPAAESTAAAAQAAASASAPPARPESIAPFAPTAQGRPDPFLHDVKVTDILLAFFTGLLALLGWTQARRMREAIAAAAESVAVAKESAGIAEKSARTAEEALVAGQRAFMFIREIKTYLHQDPETGKFHWTIHPIWANSGNTPTRNLSINTTYRLLDKPLPDHYDFPESKENLIPTTAGPRSMVEAVHGTLSSEDLEAIQQGKKFFYIWGWAEYHDIFEGTKKRVTRFCNQLVQVDGNPAMPADEHNPIQMMFGFHAENNYAD